MDKGLQIQVELHRKGEELISRILQDIQEDSSKTKLEYLLSSETVINITDFRIWVYVVAEDSDGNSKLTTISTFDNYLESRNTAKEAVYHYFLNNCFACSFSEEKNGDTDKKTVVRVIPSI